MTWRLLLLLGLLSTLAGADPLDWLVGTWDTQDVRYQEGRVQARGLGQATFERRLEGRFLHESYQGQGYSGEGWMSYDPTTRIYRWWWFDSTGSVETRQVLWDGQGPRILIAPLEVDGKPAVQRETYTRTSEREYRYRQEIDTGQGWRTTWELTARKR